MTELSGVVSNGRILTDDVFDMRWPPDPRKVRSDGVGPHRDLLAEFPYLGHRMPLSSVLPVFPLFQEAHFN